MMKKNVLLIFSAVLGLMSAGAAEQKAFEPDLAKWDRAGLVKHGEGTLISRKGFYTNRDFIKIDPKATYRISGKFKLTGEPTKDLFFFGLAVSDAGKRLINSTNVNVFPGTETVLAADAAKGSRSVLVKDISKWPKLNQAHVLAFNVKEKYADLPNFQTSVNIVKREKKGDVYEITFRNGIPWSFKKGTPVRLHAYGPARVFCCAYYQKTNWSGWKEFKAEVSSIAPYGAPVRKFWKGTCYAQVAISVGRGNIVFKDVKVEKVGSNIDVITYAAPVKKAAAVKKAPVKKAAAPIAIANAHGEKIFPKYYAEIKKAAYGPRPRMVFSQKGFDELKERMKKNVHLQNMVKELKRRVDLYPDEVNDQTVVKKYGGSVIFYGNDKGGPCSVRCAFIYKMTGDKKYAEKGLKYLRYAVDWYNRQYAAMKAVGWTVHARISAMIAYDWLYDYMSEADRKEIGQKFLSHILKAQDTRWIVRSGLQNKGEGTSPWTSSFYGTPYMKFYAGITFANAGINDKAAEQLLQTGLKDNLKMLTYRSIMSGENGGGNNSSPGYAFGGALLAERYFYIQYRALTGKNITKDFPNNSMFPHWIYYATFEGIDGRLYEHGTGGAWHFDNTVNMNNEYLALYRNFFPESPAVELVDRLISTQPKFKNPANIYASGQWRFSGYVPWMPFFYNYTDPKDYKPDQALFKRLPKAFHFPKLGQVYMASGRTRDATYAMFTCGTASAAHKQYDENHFVIYKGGFLAMDTGTRSASGLKNWLDDMWHDNNYSPHSIAHNVVLIRMEGEKWGGWPDHKYAVSNHSGMSKSTGGKVYAYETSDLFTYVAGDSTACYNPGKGEKIVRQFVCIYPDYFVIHDVVRSVKVDQKKTWLLHSQNEPRENGSIVSWDENQGRLFCKTFLPVDAVRTKVGGPGKEFFVDGKNYPLGKTRMEEYRKRYKEKVDGFLWGKWRIEVAAGENRKENEFLHLIQVGLKKDTPSMVKSEKVTAKGMTGVKFTAKDGSVWTVLFSKDGLKGHIKGVRNGKVLADKDLTTSVQVQKAFQK